MIYSCGNCNSSISISSILFSMLSLADLDALCHSYDYSTYSGGDPWYDSVKENGEYNAKKEKHLEYEDDDDDIRDEDIYSSEVYYEE